jgi:hypothetical protein
VIVEVRAAPGAFACSELERTVSDGTSPGEAPPLVLRTRTGADSSAGSLPTDSGSARTKRRCALCAPSGDPFIEQEGVGLAARLRAPKQRVRGVVTADSPEWRPLSAPER